MNSKNTAIKISNTQWQADLTWAAQSPLVVSCGRYKHSQPHCPYPCNQPTNGAPSSLLQKNISNLKQENIELTSRFLGPYFELLWSCLIERSNNLQLIEHNLQIHDTGSTLGEFDFLLKPIQEALATPNNGCLPDLIHQEVAVKFYLGLPTDNAQGTPSAWFGPNHKDRLDLKLHDMLSRQIRLSSLNGVRTKLAELTHLQIRPETVIKPEIVVKGYLFHPYHKALILPEYVNQQVLTGRWLPVSKLDNLRAGNHQWVILPKLSWLSTTLDKHQPVLSFQQLVTALKTIETSGKPQLIAAITHDKQIGFREVERFFIVSEHWQVNAEKTLLASPLKNLSNLIYI